MYPIPANLHQERLEYPTAKKYGSSKPKKVVIYHGMPKPPI